MGSPVPVCAAVLPVSPPAAGAGAYRLGATRHPRVEHVLSVRQQLGAVTSMTIGGIATAFTLAPPTLIQAVVPNRARTGTVALTYAGRSVTSPALDLPPALYAIAPTSGPVGTVVTVTGSNIPTFLTIVLLGGQNVRVAHVSSRRLTFTVTAG